MTKDELREKANDLPLQPGVYLMMDKTSIFRTARPVSRPGRWSVR